MEASTRSQHRRWVSERRPPPGGVTDLVLRGGAFDPALYGPGQRGQRQHPDAQQEVVELPEIEGRTEPLGGEGAKAHDFTPTNHVGQRLPGYEM